MAYSSITNSLRIKVDTEQTWDFEKIEDETIVQILFELRNYQVESKIDTNGESDIPKYHLQPKPKTRVSNDSKKGNDKILSDPDEPYPKRYQSLNSSRHYFSETESAILRNTFHTNPYPERTTIYKLANQFRVTPRRIRSWFLNKRYHNKKRNKKLLK